jgi:hypothetical protein
MVAGSEKAIIPDASCKDTLVLFKNKHQLCIIKPLGTKWSVALMS